MERRSEVSTPSTGQGSVDLDTAPLTPRYWRMAGTVMLSTPLEFFDYFLIGLVVTILAKPWHFTFGVAAVVLLSSGIGAMVGSLVWGWIADRWGRRPALIIGIVTFSVGTAAMALCPEGLWQYLVGWRFIVGAGVGGVTTVAVPTMVEFTPRRWRTLMGGCSVLLIPFGTFLASAMTATLSQSIGWRGLFAIGILPGLLALVALVTVPESPRWLVSKGRVDAARRTVAWMLGVKEERVSLAGATADQRPAAEDVSYRALLRHPRSLILTVVSWIGLTTSGYGLLLWAPTLIAQVLDVTPAVAASYFLVVSVGGLAGRAFFAAIPQLIGRRAAGVVISLGLVVSLLAAAAFHSVFVAGISLFWVAIIVADFFGDGGYGNFSPYASEVWPSWLRAHGMAAGQVASGIGKIAGPAGLAVLAGSGNLITPQATVRAITPACIYLAVAAALILVPLALIGLETAGRAARAEPVEPVA
jgi:MFS transporter, putative metabolite:H+ symporter